MIVKILRIYILINLKEFKELNNFYHHFYFKIKDCVHCQCLVKFYVAGFYFPHPFRVSSSVRNIENLNEWTSNDYRV